MKKFIPFAALALAIALGFLFTAQPKNPPQDAQVEQQIEMIQAQLTVDDSSFEAEVPAGSSALDLMRALDDTNDDFTFTGSDSEYGFFVKSINGRENDADASSYWTLYTNGEMAQVGVSDYLIQNGDELSWKYEKVSF